jgi:uncharacterized protein YukE
MIGQGLGRVAQAEKLSIQQLEEALENRTIPAYIGIPLLEEKVQIEQRMKMAQAGQMPPPEMTIADQVMGQAQELSGGIDQAPIDFAPEMAGGGIVAFEDGGQVQRFQNQGMVQEQIPPMTPEELRRYQMTKELPERFKNAAQTDPGALEDPGIAPRMDQPPPPPDQGLGAATRGFEPLDPTKILEQTETLYSGLYGKGTGAAAPGDKMGYVQKAEDFFKAAGVNLDMAAQQAAEIAAEKEALGKDREEAKNMRIMEAGFAIMAGTSPNAFENIGKGATKAMQGFASDIKDLQKTERELANASRQMMQAQNQIRMGVATAASDDYQKTVDRYNAASEKMADRKASLAQNLINERRSMQIVEKQMKSKLGETTDILFSEMVAKGADPNDPKTLATARREAYRLEGSTQLSGQRQREETAAAERVAKRLKSLIDPKTRMYNEAVRSGNKGLADSIRDEMLDEEMRSPGSSLVSGGEAPPLPPGFQLQPIS